MSHSRWLSIKEHVYAVSFQKNVMVKRSTLQVSAANTKDLGGGFHFGCLLKVFFKKEFPTIWVKPVSKKNAKCNSSQWLGLGSCNTYGRPLFSVAGGAGLAQRGGTLPPIRHALTASPGPDSSVTPFWMDTTSRREMEKATFSSLWKQMWLLVMSRWPLRVYGGPLMVGTGARRLALAPQQAGNGEPGTGYK